MEYELILSQSTKLVAARTGTAQLLFLVMGMELLLLLLPSQYRK